MDPLENDYSVDQPTQAEKNQTLLQKFIEEDRLEAEEKAAADAAAAPAPVEEEEAATPKTDKAMQMAEETGELPVISAVGDLLGSALDSFSDERSEEQDSERVAGKGGDVRNPIDTAVAWVADQVDNTFQGDQKTYEEIRDKIDKGKADKAKKDAEAPAIQRALAEPLRAFDGSLVGAAESALEAAEIVGDTAKTFASKVNLVGYDPKDDPFSSKYSWASWNLGKDDIGAQTGVGKITQGFGEFFVAFAGTGGGSATANLFKTGAQGLGKAGKAKAVLGTMGREALEGVKADLILAASGEGNLSNLIKENAPDWYPTWLSALSVEEDDNPYEAAFKTAFEGGLLGAPIGGIGAYIKGTRAINKLKKLKPNATEEELGNAAIEAIQGELNLGYTPPRPERPTMAYDVAPEVLNLDVSNVSKLDATELKKLETEYDAFAFDPDIQDEVIRNANPEAAMEAFGRNITVKELPNGTKIDWVQRDISSEFSRDIVGDLTYRQDAINTLIGEGIENPSNEQIEDAMQVIFGLAPQGNPMAGQKVVRIDWESNGGELGNYGTKLYKQFGEIAKDQKPGTIIQAEAAADGYGSKGPSASQNSSFDSNIKKVNAEWSEKYGLEEWQRQNPDVDPAEVKADWEAKDRQSQENIVRTGINQGTIPAIPADRFEVSSIREKLYMRAGLSETNGEGMMYGIVKYRPDGRRTMVPLDSTKPIQEQIDSAKEVPLQRELDLRQFDAQALDQLQALQAEAIPSTWDDVAAVVPQLFTPGTRQISAPEFSPEAVNRLMDLDPTNPDATAIANPFTGEQPTSGSMVNVDGAVLDEVDDPEAVAGFIGKYYDILTREDAFLTSSISPDSGRPTFEISRLVANGDEAISLGKIFDQEGVFRLDDGNYIKTGGLDQLKRTQGANLKSISTRAPQSTPVDPQRAATQTLRGEQQISPNTGTQRMLTDNQVARLGSAGPTRTAELLEEMVVGSKIDLSELAAEANMSELDIVQDALSKLGDNFDFVAADVSKLDLNAEGYLSRTGIVQSRMVMQELSSRLAQTAFNANDATAKGLNNLDKVEQMTDTLKAYMKAYKISANLNSKRLSAGGIELPAEFGVDGSQVKGLYSRNPDPEALVKAFDNSEKMINKMVEGLKGNNPKARKQSLQVAAQLELLGDQPYKLAQGISTLSEIGTKYGLKIMYNSMLSSPATHIINTTSNAIALVLRPLAAAAGGDLRSRKAAAASRYALGETLSDAMTMARRKWNTTADQSAKGIDVSTGEASLALDELRLKAEESGDIALQTGVTVMSMIEGIANLPGIGLPTRMLTTADEFFKVAVQRMEYNRMTMEEAIDLNGSDLQANFKYLLDKNRNLNFTKSGESLNKELNRIAKEVTFQGDLEGPAKRFGEWVESFPALRVFFPFVRTGHNVAMYTASYVPILGGKLAKMEGKLTDPNVSSYEKAIIKGRQRLGAAFVAASGLMAANGMLVGNGPMDPQARERWLETNQPRSIKIGDRFISLDRMEPFGPILSAVADIHYAVSEGTMKQERGKWMVGYLTQAIALNITDRTFFQGFQDMAKFISPRGTVGESMVAFFADTTNNLIPAAGLRRTLTNMINPYTQEFNSQWDRSLYNASGGVLGDTATKRDFITGEAISSMSGGINSLLPFKINKKEQNPVKTALMRIEYNSDRIVEELGRTGLKLKPEQISKLQEMMGSGGLEKELKAIVTAPDWIEAVDAYEEKVKKGHRVTRDAQLFYSEIHDTMSKYATDAMDQLKYEYPELEEALDGYQQAKDADRYGGLTDYYKE